MTLFEFMEHINHLNQAYVQAVYENGICKQDIKQDWNKRKSGGVIVGEGQALTFIQK